LFSEVEIKATKVIVSETSCMIGRVDVPMMESSRARQLVED